MHRTRLISVVAAVTLAIGLTGCSEAEKAGDAAKEKAASAAESAKAEASKKAAEKAEEAKGKAGDNAKDAADKLKDKAKGAGSGADGTDAEGTDGADGANGAGDGSVKVDLGDFADDPDAKAVTGFYEVRQAAAAADDGDVADLEAAATPAQFKKASNYVDAHAGQAGSFMVTVVGVDAGSVDVCVGPEGTRARTLTVEGGKVAGNAKGEHTCS